MGDHEIGWMGLRGLPSVYQTVGQPRGWILSQTRSDTLTHSVGPVVNGGPTAVLVFIVFTYVCLSTTCLYTLSITNLVNYIAVNTALHCKPIARFNYSIITYCLVYMHYLVNIVWWFAHQCYHLYTMYVTLTRWFSQLIIMDNDV